MSISLFSFLAANTQPPKTGGSSLVQPGAPSTDSIVGTINPPPGSVTYTIAGIVPFLNNIIKFLIVLAGVYVLFNIILAGFQFINAGGDPKNVEKAWNKIWQSVLGLIIVAGSFVLAVIFGYLVFGDPMAILSPKIYTP
jgi:hypothetical protein